MTVQSVHAACDEGVEVPSNPRRARIEPLHHTPRGRTGLPYLDYGVGYRVLHAIQRHPNE